MVYEARTHALAHRSVWRWKKVYVFECANNTKVMCIELRRRTTETGASQVPGSIGGFREGG